MKYLTFQAITRTFIYKAYNKPGMIERSFLLFETLIFIKFKQNIKLRATKICSSHYCSDCICGPDRRPCRTQAMAHSNTFHGIQQRIAKGMCSVKL